MAKNTDKQPRPGGTLPLVIVNPKSAAGSTESTWAGTASDLRTHFGPFEVEFTREKGHGIEIARQAAEDGRNFIIACGGDGTINEVANGIILSGKNSELGVIPSGTGGDFRRTLNMPLPIREAAKALRTGETKTIDAGRVAFYDFEGNTVSRYFVNVASFGLAAAIIERVKSSNKMDWLPIRSVRGRAGFALSTLQEVLDLDPVTIKIKVDGGEEKTLNTINFCIANARFFGGGMKIAPDAKMNDGLLDAINIGDLRTTKILLKAYTLYTGTHLNLPEVNSKLIRKVEVAASDPAVEIRLETDGELPGRLPATFEVVPGALRIRVPQKAK